MAKEKYLKAVDRLMKYTFHPTEDGELLKGFINEQFELKEIIKKHGLENLTNHELDHAIKTMLGYVQENNRLMNKLTDVEFVCKQNGVAYRELTKLYNELLDNAIANQEELINLKENPPLKFEDLHEGMWVWDNRQRKYVRILEVSTRYKMVKLSYFFGDVHEFEENRFYRYEVKEVKE